MTDLDLQAFEDTLLALRKRTHHCLSTLLELLKKFPSFSEKPTVSSHEKIEAQAIYTALQVAVVQLAKRISSERITNKGASLARQEEDLSGHVSFDRH